MTRRGLVIELKHVDARGYVDAGSFIAILQNYKYNYLGSLGLSRESIETANGGRLEVENLIIKRPCDLKLGDVCTVVTVASTIHDTLIFTQTIVCPRGTMTAFWHHVMRDDEGRNIPFAQPVV